MKLVLSFLHKLLDPAWLAKIILIEDIPENGLENTETCSYTMVLMIVCNFCVLVE